MSEKDNKYISWLQEKICYMDGNPIVCNDVSEDYFREESLKVNKKDLLIKRYYDHGYPPFISPNTSVIIELDNHNKSTFKTNLYNFIERFMAENYCGISYITYFYKDTPSTWIPID